MKYVVVSALVALVAGGTVLANASTRDGLDDFIKRAVSGRTEVRTTEVETHRSGNDGLLEVELHRSGDGLEVETHGGSDDLLRSVSGISGREFELRHGAGEVEVHRSGELESGRHGVGEVEVHNSAEVETHRSGDGLEVETHGGNRR